MLKYTEHWLRRSDMFVIRGSIRGLGKIFFLTPPLQMKINKITPLLKKLITFNSLFCLFSSLTVAWPCFLYLVNPPIFSISVSSLLLQIYSLIKILVIKSTEKNPLEHKLVCLKH